MPFAERPTRARQVGATLEPLAPPHARRTAAVPGAERPSRRTRLSALTRGRIRSRSRDRKRAGCRSAARRARLQWHPGLVPIDAYDLVDRFGAAAEAGVAAMPVGAGLSRGAGLPDWKELLEVPRERVGIPRGVRDLPLVAEYYEQDPQGGRDSLKDHLLRSTAGVGAVPGDGHPAAGGASRPRGLDDQLRPVDRAVHAGVSGRGERRRRPLGRARAPFGGEDAREHPAGTAVGMGVRAGDQPHRLRAVRVRPSADLGAAARVVRDPHVPVPRL